MICAKNYENMFTFIKVMHRINCSIFFVDTVDFIE